MPLYTITNEDKASRGYGRSYVGSCTITLCARLSRHYYKATHATDKSPELYRDMKESYERVKDKYPTATAAFRELYPAQVVLGEQTPKGARSLVEEEQALLDAMRGLDLSLTPYNVRRPQALTSASPEAVSEHKAKRAASYASSKSMCSCGRMVSKGNYAHMKSAVHLKATA
jgi:hypothetical protein